MTAAPKTGSTPVAYRPMSLRRSVLVLGSLSVFGPLSMDMYMPSLPELAERLDTNDTLAQATMSACMIGLGLGQLITGPLSDRIGRKRPLVFSVAAFALLSLACALAPNIEILLVLRLFQGISGGAGMVISMAMARDMFSGSELSQMLSLLSLVSMSAPIMAPVIGGQLSQIMDWRGIFFVLTGIGTALFFVALIALRDTLPPERRSVGGMKTTVAHFRVLMRDKVFLSLMSAGTFSSTAFFAYLSMSSFVFQNEFEVTPAMFSIIFAANSVAMLAGSQLNALLVKKTKPRIMFALAGSGATLAALTLMISTFLGTGLMMFIILLSLYMFTDGPSHPNRTTIALHDHGTRAGTAASALGTTMFLVGPIVVPILSLGGANSMIMASTIFICMLATTSIIWLVVWPMLVRRGR